MEGIGTRDEDLIRLIISRCEVDLETVKEEFELLYGKALAKVVESETSSHYQSALLSLIDGNETEQNATPPEKPKGMYLMPLLI